VLNIRDLPWHTAYCIDICNVDLASEVALGSVAFQPRVLRLGECVAMQ